MGNTPRNGGFCLIHSLLRNHGVPKQTKPLFPECFLSGSNQRGSLFAKMFTSHTFLFELDHQKSSNINKHQQKIYAKYKNNQQTKHQTCYTCICLAMLKFQKPIVPKAGTSNMCRKAKSMRIKFCWNHASSYSPQVANHRTTGTQQLNVQPTAASGLIPNPTPKVQRGLHFQSQSVIS